jgi:hypothetical protein
MGVDIKILEQSHTPLTPGSTSPQQSAAMKIQNMNQTQASVNKIGGIRRKKYSRRKKRGGNTIAVPPTSTSTMNVNGLLAKVATSDVNSQSNSEFDKGAYKGGSKKKRTRRRSKNKKTRRHRR